MGTVSWRKFSRNDELIGKGIVEYGDMLPMLLNQERAAAKLMDETDCRHVLYGMKLYDREGKVAAVHLYLWPMSEDEFDKVAMKCRGCLVYALHNNRRRKDVRTV